MLSSLNTSQELVEDLRTPVKIVDIWSASDLRYVGGFITFEPGVTCKFMADIHIPYYPTRRPKGMR